MLAEVGSGKPRDERSIILLRMQRDLDDEHCVFAALRMAGNLHT
jgi:hypothetical protein